MTRRIKIFRFGMTGAFHFQRLTLKPLERTKANAPNQPVAVT